MELMVCESVVNNTVGNIERMLILVGNAALIDLVRTGKMRFPDAMSLSNRGRNWVCKKSWMILAG